MPADDGAFFSVSYDTVTKILSGIFCAFLLAAMLLVHNLFVGAFLILVLFLGYAYSPRGYTVADRTIIVQRLAGDVRIPLENVRELRRATPADLRGCIRLWGSGGLFGYYGLFRTSMLGKCTWYATDRKKLVVLIGERKTTIYSPDDIEGFLSAVRDQVPIPAGGSPIAGGARFDGTLVHARSSALWIGLIVAIAAALGALAAVLAIVNHRIR